MLKLCFVHVGEQEVNSLLVRCPTSCEWNGELRSLEHHMQKDCGNTLVPCPKNCKIKIIWNKIDYHLAFKCLNRPHSCTKCQKQMEFRSVKNHELNECPKRQYTCPHCNEAGVYDERTTTHLEACPKVKIECSKCLVKISRCDQASHVLACPDEPVRCKYYNIGCAEKPLRKKLTRHEDNAQMHLALAADKILKLTNILVVKNTLKLKMKDFKEKKDKVLSPDFHTSELGYKLCLRVDPNDSGAGEGTHVAVYACLMKGDNDDSLSWPFTGTVTIELLNQLEDKNHHKMTITFPADNVVSQRVVERERGEGGYGYRKFISHADLAHKPLTNTQYLKDDTLIFRVSAEAPDYKPWLECSKCV